MKFIDINALSKTNHEAAKTTARKKFCVDLAAISAVTIEYVSEELAKSNPGAEPGWAVGVSTPLGYKGVLCKDEIEAEQVCENLLKMIEADRVIPYQAHSATASAMIDKMKNW